MKRRGGDSLSREDAAAAAAAPGQAELEFEDPFEESWGSESEGMDDDADMGGAAGAAAALGPDGLPRLDAGEPEIQTRTWHPGMRATEGEGLEINPDAYVVYTALNAEWPCLSVDIVPDQLGAARTRLPLSMYWVAGTQAAPGEKNSLQVMKCSNVRRLPREDSDDDSDSSSDGDDEPVLSCQNIPHQGGVNRVRVMPQAPHVAATWADTGAVHLWDLRPALSSIDVAEQAGFAPHAEPGAFARGKGKKPIYSWAGHRDEGFAMAWSPRTAGKLLTGACSGGICYHSAQTGAVERCGTAPAAPVPSWCTKRTIYRGHTGSVEDVAWSPTEETVFASCGVDKTVRIWDTRKSTDSMITVPAATCDVNVIAWNSAVPHLLASGNDDGSFVIWDLRNFRPDACVARFQWHTDAITSIAWDPADENVIAAAGADHQISIWDMSLEADTKAGLAGMTGGAGDLADLPPQLLFIHQGQTDIKEVHWHAQIPGLLLSTAATGFNLFKPDIQVEGEDEAGAASAAASSAAL